MILRLLKVRIFSMDGSDIPIQVQAACDPPAKVRNATRIHPLLLYSGQPTATP